MNTQTGLATDENLSEMSSFQKYSFSQLKSKLGVNAVYYLRDQEGVARIPLIYFSMIEDGDRALAAKLHSLAWNMGEAPLLFVVTPTELKIYNNYQTPKKENGELDPGAGLIETISLVNNLETQRKELSKYNRTLFECGDYWQQNKDRFDVNLRIDTTLMNNLKIMRKRLISKISSRVGEKFGKAQIASIVHGLLSRSILIKYLEERKDTNGASVFPNDFYSQFKSLGKNCSSYTDVLGNKKETYRLFEILEQKFNGDMLPLAPNEEEIINEDDLLELKSFLLGDSDLESNQLSLWPLYDFNIIPIKIISSIYELFFHLSENEEDDKGTYYTPLHLVDTLLDEIYPWEGDYQDIKIIDPACGSGVFLVEIYRRIVCRWMYSNNTYKITNKQLTALLTKSVFGIDINEEAARVASFSLSLALCDFLDPRSIWDELSFPKLVGNNLIVSDFFDSELSNKLQQYDIVIGNPPWQSQLTEKAHRYLQKHNCVVGDKQIAQAFSIKCSDICKKGGNICLLMPSKGLLFNRSAKSNKYRQKFFSENTVYTIINFSIYRKFLFDNASAPCTAIFYCPKNDIASENSSDSIFYCTPKPQYSIQDTKKFSIDPTDICRIPSDMIHDDRIWKVAMWGNPRDLELIDRLQSTYLSLDEFLKKNEMISAEGYIKANGGKKCDSLLGMPLINVDNFQPFYFSKNNLNLNFDNDFYRCSSQNVRVFESPHLIMKQSHRKGRFYAAVLDYAAIFNHSLLGIAGNEQILKYLCLIINSKMFTYYHLLTSRTWMVERDALEAGDIRTMPIPKPNNETLNKASSLFDEIKVTGNENNIDSFVFQMYNLKPYEINLVNDTINYTYNYFDKKGSAIAFNSPSNVVYSDYYKTIIDVLSNSFDTFPNINGVFYVGQSPLTVLSLSFDEKKVDDLQYITDNEETEKILLSLDQLLLEKCNNIFIRRNVRVYGKDSIYIVKPKQEKYWNYSSACNDADEIFADIMNAKE